jgi:nucleoside-diphosphate-sugar epimerase
MKQNVLVTGGAGYLGSVMVPMLLDKGYNVTVIDNFLFNQNSLHQYCYLDDLSLIKGDVRDRTVMKSAVSNADIIIPLAAMVGAPMCNNDKVAAASINRDAIEMMCELVSSEQKVLMPITNSGYGIGETGKYCTEETALNPISLYGQTKVEAEAIMLEKAQGVSFRLATVFGMSQRMRMDLLVNDFVWRAYNDRAIVLFESHFKRNFIHIRDVANAFLFGIENFDKMTGEAFNVGLSDANLSKWELCERIKEYVPSFVFMEAEIGEDPDKRDYIVSNEKIESLGFKPRFSLDDGIKELLKGYPTFKKTLHGNV